MANQAKKPLLEPAEFDTDMVCNEATQEYIDPNKVTAGFFDPDAPVQVEEEATGVATSTANFKDEE